MSKTNTFNPGQGLFPITLHLDSIEVEQIMPGSSIESLIHMNCHYLVHSIKLTLRYAFDSYDLHAVTYWGSGTVNDMAGFLQSLSSVQGDLFTAVKEIAEGGTV